MRTIAIATTKGNFTAVFSERGLARLDFPGRRSSVQRESATTGWLPAKLAGWRRLTAKALAHSLEGKRPRRLPPLDLKRGTAFQCRVWRALRGISTGRTRSYGDLAALVGNPRGARAVGAACGANPVPVLIPCHRVLAADGSLGGFSGGLAWKRRLLEVEGVPVRGV